MTYDKVVDYFCGIVRSREWVGHLLVLHAMPLTLQEGQCQIEEARQPKKWKRKYWIRRDQHRGNFMDVVVQGYTRKHR